MEKDAMQKITELLTEIYGDAFTGAHLKQLTENISACAREINRPRKPGWDENDVVLITYADQFSCEGESRLKTLDRIRARWLAEQFSHIHLLPFYPWSSDDGFSVIDYHQVDPISGDWRDISRLNNSTRLMFDFVCNHISARSEWFTRYLALDPQYADFFIDVDPATDLSAVTRPRALPLLSPFRDAAGRERHLWTTFSDDQIDLNYENPQVLLAMVDVLLHYLREGAEYIRLDAVGYMWKTPGTRCIHLPKTHLLVKLFRAIVDHVAPGTLIITETNVPHQDNIAYLGNGHDEAHMVYQFTLPPLVLHAIHTGSVVTLCEWAQSLQPVSTDTTWFNFLASHDGIGLNPLRGILPEEEILALVDALQQEGALVNWKNNPDGSRSPYEINVTYMDAVSRRDSSNNERLARFIMAHAILLSFPGVPAIYIQSILGARNDYDGVKRLGYNRAINRRKYTESEIDALLGDTGSLNYQVYQQLSHLIRLRRQHCAFHPDSAFTIEAVGESVICLTRTANNGETIIALFNLGETPFYFELPPGDYQELITATTLITPEVIVKPWQVMWLRQQ